MTTTPLYRPCVGIALFNKEGKVFVGERIDTPGAWQMPQGGIDPDEDLKTAAFRELKEEIGTDNAEILHILEDTIHYDIPAEILERLHKTWNTPYICLLYTSPSPRDQRGSRMPSSA